MKKRYHNQSLFILARLVRRFPLRLSLAIGRALGQLAPMLSPKHLHRIATDIALAFPHLSARETERLARQSYVRLGQSLVEFLRLPDQTPEEIRRWVRLEGAEHLDAALARGHGAIVASAHLGNWEICATGLAVHGYPISAIARPQRDTALTGLVDRIRQRHGLAVLPMDKVRDALRVLKRNACLGIICDLNAKTPSVFVQFFGRPAATYTSAAYFALATGAALLPIFDEPQPDGSHRIRIHPPLALVQTGDRKRDEFLNTIRLQRVIEAEIRRRPADWYWLVRRWHTRPEDITSRELLMEHRDLSPVEAGLLQQEAATTSISRQNA